MVARTPAQLAQDVLDQGTLAQNLAALITDPRTSDQANSIALTLSRIGPLVAKLTLAPPTSPLGRRAPPPPYELPDPTYFANDVGTLVLVPSYGANYPIDPGTLAPGGVWSDVGVVSIIPGFTPMTGPPMYYNITTPTILLHTGGVGLPTTNPNVHNQLWNDGNTVAVST